MPSRTASSRRLPRLLTDTWLTRSRNRYAHTTRFPPPHSLGEEHPADYAGHEVRGCGAPATGPGSGAGGPAVCKGTGARAALDDGAARVAAASVAGPQTGRADPGDRALGRERTGGGVQRQYSETSGGISPEQAGQEDGGHPDREEGPGCVAQSGDGVRR